MSKGLIDYLDKSSRVSTYITQTNISDGEKLRGAFLHVVTFVDAQLEL